MTADGGNGSQPPPLVGGQPLQSEPVPWAWEIHRAPARDADGSEVYLLRLRLPVGLVELWAPASFMRDMAEKIALQISGLHIARKVPPEDL